MKAVVGEEALSSEDLVRTCFFIFTLVCLLFYEVIFDIEFSFQCYGYYL